MAVLGGGCDESIMLVLSARKFVVKEKWGVTGVWGLTKTTLRQARGGVRGVCLALSQKKKGPPSISFNHDEREIKHSATNQ